MQQLLRIHLPHAQSSVVLGTVKDSKLFPSLQMVRKSNFIYIRNVRELLTGKKKRKTKKDERKGSKNQASVCETHTNFKGATDLLR